eukprot:TRINITY_DN27933_c0_g5_i1.p1 TRINITY_DN27933_c0_g5~~TRINITY_DN27933_c0_g5_i1.p1  ORF type:complete len:399 (-),score=34.35 TRINITY_DN27933_c0_g5_i1:322-1518(-)
MASSSDGNVAIGNCDEDVWSHFYSYYSTVRVELQLAGLVISVAMAVTDIYLNGKITIISLLLFSGVPVCGFLAYFSSHAKVSTSLDLEKFDRFSVAFALLFDLLVFSSLYGNKSYLFENCIAYITPTFVHFQNSRTSFARLFMFVHCIMICFLFQGDLERCVPFLSNCSILVLFHGRLGRSLGAVAAEQIVANLEAEKRTESLIDALLTVFCDASFALDHTWKLSHASKSLAALLGRQKVEKGAELESFIDMGDRDEFRRYMNTPFETEQAGSAAGHADVLRLQSVRVHLYDVYNIPFPVHIFCVTLRKLSGEVKKMVGISEAYQARSSAPKPAKKRAAMTYNMGSGKLESETAIVDQPEVLLSEAAKRANIRSRSSGGGSARKRGDSPRPEIVKKDI